MVGEVNAGLLESNGSLPPGLWLRSHLLTAWEWDQLQNPTFVLSMGPLPLPNARYCQSLGIFGARFFTGRMPVLSPNQHHQSVAEGSEKNSTNHYKCNVTDEDNTLYKNSWLQVTERALVCISECDSFVPSSSQVCSMHLLHKRTHQTITAIYYSSIKGVNLAEFADQKTLTHRAASKTMHWIYVICFN